MKKEPCLNCLEKRVEALEMASLPVGISNSLRVGTPECAHDETIENSLESAQKQLEKTTELNNVLQARLVRSEGETSEMMALFVGCCDGILSEVSLARQEKDESARTVKLLKIQQGLEQTIAQFSPDGPGVDDEPDED
jgi:hypothetical protein